MSIFAKYSWKENKAFSLMDNEGHIHEGEFKNVLSDQDILNSYKKMFLSRILDEKMLSWQRQGKFPSFLTSTGQEATEVGYATQIRKGKDWFVPAYRNMAAFIALDIDLARLIAFWLGSEKGNARLPGERVLPIAITIGAQYSHALGLAFAEKYKKTDNVAFVTTGDGGTSEGEFYEAMNLAGVYSSPVVFMVENNGFALSTPKKYVTKANTFAQKAVAAGIPSIIVDGNDLLAVAAASKEAAQYARTHGPVLIEFRTYRIGGHASSDDPNIYRNKEEHAAQILKDPLIRIKKYLISKHLWNEDQEVKYKEESIAHIDKEFAKATELAHMSVDDIFKYTYHEIDADLKHQWEEAKREMEGK